METAVRLSWKRERNDSDEPEVLYSSVVAVPSAQTDEELMASLVSRDERLDYLLSLRESERAMRLTEDQVLLLTLFIYFYFLRERVPQSFDITYFL
ncbi:hypothetical protein Tcan_02275 [Toxocara canis]|uniref:Uncharacterized protein n=1 Tax=Toxocara canis TaxID=6265 RepID=A0A0B2UQB7_TOXCA|nr:hypothetical protein Tcan_02275 [Toxocara canis]